MEKKEIALYILAVLLLIIAILYVGNYYVSTGAVFLLVTLLLYQVFEDYLASCYLIKYLGLPLLVFGFLIALFGVGFSTLSSYASTVMIAGYYIEIIGLILYAIGFIVGYYRGAIKAKS